MNISLQGLQSTVATFSCASTVEKGDFVKMSGNNTVTKCSANGDFIGIVLYKRGDICTVMLSGFTRCKYTGTVAVGKMNVVLASDQTLKVAGSTGGYNSVIVTDVNSTDSTFGIILK